MPLTTLSLSATLQWTLQNALTGFQALTQGQDQQQFTLATLNLATFDQLLAVNYSIAASSHEDFDLYSFTNLVNEATGFGTNGALSLVILPTVGNVSLSPGGSNPLTWFFTGTTPGLTLTAGGVFVFSLPPAGPGQTVDATHRILTLTNPGGASASGYFFALGG